jgi:DNA-binding transcriptional LysR family regulator
MIDVRRLHVLREVAATGSVSGAARTLGYTPSAVSQQLVALERETATELIRRRGRGIELTESARRLLEHAQVIFAELERAEATLSAAAGRTAGVVRLAAPATALGRLVPYAVLKLRRVAPEIELRISDSEPEEALAALANRRLDVAVAHQYDLLAPWRTDGLHRRELLVDPLLLLGAAPGPEPVGLESLANEPWLLPSEGSSCGRMVRRACENAGFLPNPVAVSRDLGALASMACAGLGIALVPRLALTADQQPHATMPDPPHVRRLFAVVRDGTEHQPAVAAVLAALTSAAEDTTHALENDRAA